MLAIHTFFLIIKNVKQKRKIKFTPGSVQEVFIMDVNDNTNRYANTIGMAGWMFVQINGHLLRILLLLVYN